MIEQYIAPCIAGGIGQAVRVLAGLKKANQDGKSYDGQRIIESMLTGFFVGGAIGIMSESVETAFFTGYAGTDFLEAMIHRKQL